jgi:hypothetical protein
MIVQMKKLIVMTRSEVLVFVLTQRIYECYYYYYYYYYYSVLNILMPCIVLMRKW